MQQKSRLTVDQYAELKDVLADTPGDTIILPSADDLFDYLTCKHKGKGWSCRTFVCYSHNPELRPERHETTLQIPAPGNKWSRPIPQRIIQQFEDRLQVTV